jgi:hypothetical protein
MEDDEPSGGRRRSFPQFRVPRNRRRADKLGNGIGIPIIAALRQLALFSSMRFTRN